MKYEQSYTEFDYKVLSLIKSKIPGDFAESLEKDGVKFALPNAEEMELKLKYDIKEDGGAFSLKFSWDNEMDTETDKEEYDD